jgi:hypothetical protein
VIRDSLYRQILERLGEPLEPHAFERCVCDLLRDAFPGLVLVSGGGGSDRGMDGAIADGDLEAYSLVATTRADFHRNLESSLDSQLRHGKTRRQVVFATSQQVNPSARQRLELAARERGFTLLQVFDRRAIADRLYRNQRWRSELVGLGGAPSALSAVPPRPRPLLMIEPVGRERDLDWLRHKEGDRLLIGEPGSGKTFLLHLLAKEGGGLFLVDDDRTAIANALRELEPAAVLVDDAHDDPERLTRLRHLRTDVGADFEIVAATWKGSRDRVAEALGSPAETQVHTLEGLTRNEIVEIYRRAGVETSSEVMRELVDQAANNPGLAVTLAQVFLRGEFDSFIRGEALSRRVTGLFDGLIGGRATPILAAFAIGGDPGMTVDAVAQALSLGRLEVREVASGLAAGGVLVEAGGTLAVRPRQLRAALVAKAFFSDTPALDGDWRGLAELAPSRDDVATTLFLAASRGGRVPASVLREEALRSSSRRVWRSLAHLSESHAEWVLDHYPDDLRDVLEATLDRAPEAALPHLLAKAAQAPRTGWPAADRLATLGAWLREDPDPGEAMHRRELTVRAATSYLSAGGRPDVGVQALCTGLSPRLESSSRDPGMGDTITVSLGRELPASTIAEFHRLWNQSKETLPPLSGAEWREIRTLLREWSRPNLPSRGGPENLRARQDFAAQVLRDIAARSAGGPGLISELQRAAESLDSLQLDLGLERDRVFELLFDDDALAYDEKQASREAELDALAAKWAQLDPFEALAAYGSLEAEAREYRSHLNFWQARKFGSLLAAAVEEPEVWLAAALDNESGFALTEALLRRTADLRRPDWEKAIERSLAREQTAWSAAELVLEIEDPPEDLLIVALEKAARFPQLVETLATGGRIPTATLHRLLGHPDWRVGATAAIGEWNAQPQGQVRPKLQVSWRSAILRSQTSECAGAPSDQNLDFWLSAILASDPDLALNWLRARLDEPESLPSGLLMDETSSHSPFAVAARSLSSVQKIELLGTLHPLPETSAFVEDLVTLTIGRDAALYRELLEQEHLAAYHLAPLRGRPDPAWRDMASLALAHGASPEAIVDHCFSVPWSIAGSGTDYWESWKTDFESLLSDPRPEIREIGRLGSERTQERVREADDEWKEQQRRGF